MSEFSNVRQHVAVIGGGFAGAAAASALTEAGVTVTLLEEKATLGGRATSLKDGVTREEIDNGQHLFMGCYHETLQFLTRLRVEDRIHFQRRFSIPFYSASGRSVLRSWPLPGDWGLLAGLFSFRELGFTDKLSILRAAVQFNWDRQRDLRDKTVAQWLTEMGQTAGARRAFWEPLCLATLNERMEIASAEGLAVVLREGLMNGPENRALGYATIGLGKMWPVELINYVKRHSGLAAPQQKVTGFRWDGRRIRAAIVEGGGEVEADVFISAVPAAEFLRICPEEALHQYESLSEMSASPILSVNLWFSKAPFAEPFVGFLDREVQWVFHRARLWGGRGTSEGALTCVLSAARGYPKKSSEDLIEIALRDLRQAFPDFKEEPRHAAVLWERRATPSPTPAFWRVRPSAKTIYGNLFLAGDWVNTGLPPTIESAVKSGHRAALLAKEHLDHGWTWTPPAEKEEVPC